MYFETHAHYNNHMFKQDRHELMLRMHNTVSHIVNIAWDIPSARLAIDMAQQYSFAYATVGFHPGDSAKMKPNDEATLMELCNDKKVLAVGEIGLDHHYSEPPRDIQERVFRTQLKIAQEVNLPIIIHCREAHGQTFDILKKAQMPTRQGRGAGVMHCYSGSVELALEYVKMGYYLGVGGVVTYKNAKNLIDVVAKIPLEHILIETDAPYLTPIPNRGKRNDSTNLKYVVERIAQIKGCSPENVADATTANALNFFEL
ncbi:MAG: TatD family hydrolase [Defluviitaleaceae bacterium]|nr:TatD family hydrolase [Defluviitaleaceae bacterium]